MKERVAPLATLSHRLVTRLMAGETSVAQWQLDLQLTRARPLYTVLNVLAGLGCVRRARKGEYHWCGSGSAIVAAADAMRIESPATAQPLSICQRTVQLARYLTHHQCDAAKKHTVASVMSALRWTTARPLYDILNVMAGIGLVRKRERSGDFEWVPALQLPSILDSAMEETTRDVWDVINDDDDDGF